MNNIVRQPLVPKRMWAGFEERNPTIQSEKTTPITPIFVATMKNPFNHIAGSNNSPPIAFPLLHCGRRQGEVRGVVGLATGHNIYKIHNNNIHV